MIIIEFLTVVEIILIIEKSDQLNYVFLETFLTEHLL